MNETYSGAQLLAAYIEAVFVMLIIAIISGALLGFIRYLVRAGRANRLARREAAAIEAMSSIGKHATDTAEAVRRMGAAFEAQRITLPDRHRSVAPASHSQESRVAS